MQRLSGKPNTGKDPKTGKLQGNLSKNKKQLKPTSSKNLKSLKIIGQKGQPSEKEGRIKQSVSPEMGSDCKQMENDYGVNTYYVKYKVKTTRKRQNGDETDRSDYGRFSSIKEGTNQSVFDIKNEKGSSGANSESDYASTAFQKLKIPSNRGVINDDGKFVPMKREKESTNKSYQQDSVSKQTFSLNFTAKDHSRNKKGGKSKSKNRRDLQQQKSQEYRVKCKSLSKIHSKQHQSYYQKSRNQHKSKKKIKAKVVKSPQFKNLGGLNSKATSVGTETQIYSALCLTQDTTFMDQVKDEMTVEIQNFKLQGRRQKLSEIGFRERLRCLQLLSRICGTLGMKRTTYCLAVHYMDRYCADFAYQSLKLVALGCLTLALKMDDAEMISKFCFLYLYNPERTVKKAGSNQQLKVKQKRESVNAAKEEGKEMKARLATILAIRIAQEKKGIKQEFTLEEVLDYETQIMLRFGFKLSAKTITYWLDMLTALWDSYIGQFCPKYIETLIFRNQRMPRNLSYLLQLVELEYVSMNAHGHSMVSMALAGIYLIARMALHQKKEETSWEELCRHYKMSLAKTSNLIFCDGIGINVLFGDFLSLFELSMTNIIECVQLFSRHLQPEFIKIFDYKKVEGGNREDRLAVHLHSEELYRNLGL